MCTTRSVESSAQILHLSEHGTERVAWSENFEGGSVAENWSAITPTVKSRRQKIDMLLGVPVSPV